MSFGSNADPSVVVSSNSFPNSDLSRSDDDPDDPGLFVLMKLSSELPPVPTTMLPGTVGLPEGEPSSLFL